MCLTATGQFESDTMENFNSYTEYKRGFARLRSTAANLPSFTVIIFDDNSQCLNPLDKNTITSEELAACQTFSSQVSDSLSVRSITSLKWPRLPSLLLGLCQRYLDNHDDVGLIGAEQLVDGMDLTKEWCDENLSHADSRALALAYSLIDGKGDRMDPFLENAVTCFIRSQSDAKMLRQLPGYESNAVSANCSKQS